MRILEPGSKAHRLRYMLPRIIIATVGAVIATGMSVFIEYYFHLVDFLSPFVNGIIRVMAIILFFSFIFMYVRYMGSLNYEYNAYYGVSGPEMSERRRRRLERKQAAREAKLEKQKAAEIAKAEAKKAKRNADIEKELAKQRADEEKENAKRAAAQAKEQEKLDKQMQKRMAQEAQQQQKAQALAEKERRRLEKKNKGGNAE